MKKWSVRILVKSGETFIYTTEQASGGDAMNVCGLMFRLSGHDTDIIDEIAVHEIF